MSDEGLLRRTKNFGFGLIQFNLKPWHTKEYDNWERLDALLGNVISMSSLTGIWVNSTSYEVTDIAVDQYNGKLYKVMVDHVSAVEPTTFEADRLAHPSFWQAVQRSATNRGEWQPLTQYYENDFFTYENMYGVYVRDTISGSTITGDASTGAAVILIDTGEDITLIANYVAQAESAKDAAIIANTSATSAATTATTASVTASTAASTASTAATTATTSAETAQDVLEDVQALAETIEGQLSYKVSGTGSVTRLMKDKVKEVWSVKDFGAKGDGTTDDTNAFLLAAGSGHSIFVPTGEYKVTMVVAAGVFWSDSAVTFNGGGSVKVANIVSMTMTDCLSIFIEYPTTKTYRFRLPFAITIVDGYFTANGTISVTLPTGSFAANTDINVVATNTSGSNVSIWLKYTRSM